ncbi:MAG: PQQ-binding-like beta-propeller repeat protein [Pirellulaceae bacterium]|nr:PQQ-binding-like beta-propeller repeat protein [Pirellulaceae bacterium]
MAIDFSAEGPISEDNIKWDYRKQVPNMPSPIVIDGAVYFVNDRGIMTCLDAETGTRYWQSRLRGGFSSSPLLADGKIYVGNHDGEMFVIEPNKKELVILAENTLDSQIMASPVAFGRTLYVRTADSLYRFENAQ